MISDGVDHRTNVQATDDLPATLTVNPSLLGSGDEGTAMLEIVYDIAPGAALYFSSGMGSGNTNMVDSINWLVSQGCDVIVDDLGVMSESYFSDGSVATAAVNAIASGSIYVTAAGNFAQQHYQADFNAVPGTDWHNFGGGDNQNAVTIGAGQTFSAYLQWSDPFGNSSNDYDLYLYQVGNQALIASSTYVQDGTGHNPYETLTYTNTSGSPVAAYVAVKKYNGDPRQLELYTHGGSSLEYVTSGDSIFGQGAAAGVITVRRGERKLPHDRRALQLAGAIDHL